jgi:hypothetical protein
VSDVDELRRVVAAQRGIPETAASLLIGETVAELEQSASKLAALIDTSREQAPEHGVDDPLAHALHPAHKAEQKRRLIEMLHGHPQQRDAHGRFAKSGQSRGFDGGARTSLPAARPPEQAHAELLGHLVTAAKVYTGGGRI